MINKESSRRLESVEWMRTQHNEDWNTIFGVGTIGSWVKTIKNMSDDYDYIRVSEFLNKMKCCVDSFALKHTPKFKVLDHWISTIGREIDFKRSQKYSSIFTCEELGRDPTDLR